MTVQDIVPYAQIAAGIAVSFSAGVAALLYWLHKRTARQRATLDMVLNTFIDQEGRARYDRFCKLIDKFQDDADEADLLVYAAPDAPRDDNKNTLRDQLNEYELIALGIRKKVFDEAIYKLWFQGQFERDYQDLCPYINKVRESRPSVYCEFVWLYERWQKRPHPENAPGRFKVAFWGLTGNQAKLKAYTNINGGCD